MRKRALSLLLSVALVLSLLPTAVFAEETGETFAEETGETGTAEAMSGNCGESGHENEVQWALTENEDGKTYTLTISGSGRMKDFSWSKVDSKPVSDEPWLDMREAITEVRITGDVTYVGQRTLNNSAVKKLTIADSVTEIGEYAFASNPELTDVDLGTGLSKLGKGAFIANSSLKKITLPLSITEIDNQAFDSTALTDCDLEKCQNLTTIGKRAFFSTKLSSVTIPASVKTIAQETFMNCEKLDSVTFGANTGLLMMWNVFKGCTSLKTVDMSNVDADASSWGEGPFSGCTQLKTVLLPTGSSFTALPYRFFYQSGIETVEIPENVTSWGEQLFADCKNLKAVVIHSSSLTLGSSLFLSDDQTVILYCIDPNIASAFEGKMCVVAITNGGTFTTLPDSNAELATPEKYDSLFVGWFTKDGTEDGDWGDEVTSETTLTTNTTYYAKWEAVQLSGNCGEKNADGNLGTNVQWALTENGSGYTLTISGSGRTCDSFDDVKVTVGGEEKSIMNAYGEKVSKIVVEEGVTCLGANLTRNTKNVEISIPASVTEMCFAAEATESSASTLGNTYYDYSDGKQTAANIAKIIVADGNPSFKMVDGVLFNTDETIIYRYTDEAAADYVVPGTVTAIAAKAFARSDKLTSVTIPEGVTYIGRDCFDKSYNLSGTMVIPASVETLGGACFSQLPNLTGIEFKATDLTNYGALRSNTNPPSTGIKNVTFAEGTKALPASMLSYLDLLETIDLPESLETIGDNAFYHCSALKTVNVKGNLTSIGASVFSGTQLSSFTLTKDTKLTKIGAQTFQNTKLTEIVIPDAVTEIGDQAFAGCTELTSITISPDSQLKTIGAAAFSGTGAASIYLPSGANNWATYAFGGAINLAAVDLTAVVGPVTTGGSAFYNTRHWQNRDDLYVNRVYYMADDSLKGSLGDNAKLSIYAITNGGTFTTLPNSNTELATPEKDGYAFGGWYDNEACTGTAAESFAAGKTYYAKWVLAEPGDLKPDFSAYTVRVEHADRTGRKEYALDTEGGIIDEKLSKSYGEYSYTVTIDPAVFVALYNADVTDGNHVMDADNSTSMTFSWKWENGAWKPRVSGTTLATVRVAHELPVYLYFQTINNRTGSDVAVDLTETDLARAGLTYEPDMHNGYHNYARLISGAALPLVKDTRYTDTAAAPFSTVLAELANASDANFTLHADSTNFRMADKIVWTDLLYSRSSHNGWSTGWTAAYHMDGTLRVWNVAFDANADDAVGMPENMNGYYIDTAALTLPELTREGYTFAGWELCIENTDGTYTETDVHYAAKVEMPVTGNWKFAAQWTANTYTVTFNANGGEGTMATQTFTYDVAQNLTANTFTRAGYNFTGWNTAEDGSGTTYANEAEVKNLTAEQNGNVNLYAQWEIRVPVGSAELVENLPEGTYGEAYTGSVTANKTFTDEDCVKLVLLDAEGNVLNTTDIGSGLTYVNGAVSGTATAAGAVTFTVALLNVENQVVCQKTCTITINKAQGSGSVSIADWTYGETASQPVPVSATNGTDNVTYFYKVKDAADSTYTAAVPTDAGEYTVKAVFAATDNYLECSVTADFTIRKAVIASVDLDVTAPEVGGKPQHTVADGEHYTASISWSPADDPFDFNTAYTATVTLTPENGNYTFDGTEIPAGWEASYDEETGVLTLIRTFPKTDMDTVKTPVITPNGGLVTGGAAVRVTCETEGAVIHYTTDGSTPTKNSPVYTGELYVYMTMTLKAIAVKDEFYDSAVASAEFSVYIPVDPVNGCTLTFNTNGGSAIPGVTAPAGTKISLAGYVPTKTGYTFDGWYLDGALTQPVTEVVLTYSVTVYAKWTESAQAKLPFTDVKTGDWFYEGVDYVWSGGLMNGVSADTFAPYANTTRGMIVTILARMEGVNTAGTPWYAVGREWAMANGVSDGTNMESEITREQLAAMLYRYANLKGYDVSATMELISFTDGDQVSEWAEDAMKWAVANGLIKGRSDALAPKDKATRGEVATVLMRFCETVGK